MLPASMLIYANKKIALLFAFYILKTLHLMDFKYADAFFCKTDISNTKPHCCMHATDNRISF